MTLSLEAGDTRSPSPAHDDGLKLASPAIVNSMLARYERVAVLLRHLGWPVTPRQVLEALPPAPGPDAATDLRDVLGRLGFSAMVQAGDRFSLKTLERLYEMRRDRRLPLMYLPAAGGGAPLLVEPRDHHLTVIRPQEGGTAYRTEQREGLEAGFVIVLAPPVTGAMGGDKQPWLRSRLGEGMPLVMVSMLLTLLANILALANPLFVMQVYDKVIAANQPDLLVMLGIGAIGAGAMELAVRRARSRTMGHAGARLGYLVGNAVLGRLLNLPSSMTERVSIAAQLARVRDIDRVRDLLTGPLAQACMDLPFMFLFIAAIFVMGGWLGLVPLVAVGIYALVAVIANAIIQRRVTRSAMANARRQELALEIIERMKAIRILGDLDIWRQRYENVVREAATANLSHSQGAATVATVSVMMGTLTALATLLTGIHFVMEGTLTTGGLIASMMLIWRMLGPLQAAFTASARLTQIRSSMKQIETLMATAPERSEAARPNRGGEIEGRVTFSRVTFRYGRESEPVLGNISFEVAPREVIALVGRCGGGKSTLLKLVSGLYTAQGGSVRIDGRDIRQFDPVQLRRSIAFVTQVPQFFQGTLADNLRLAAPTASDNELMDALDRAGALDAVRRLKGGLETRFDLHEKPLPTAVQARLSLARAYLRNAPLVLLDEPISGFDFEGEFAFMSAIEALRQQATVFFATHRRSHLGIADKVLILENGTTRYFGTADKVRDRIPKGMI
ncbi:peptidase domain-containing ABC transporter [Niveispirillum sp. KHB5.9]|uniref:peptidase domain-containing ABC transporter n=1 Tax=Niveispirillum sp. KHB5.9 TaxID=3400269 RepID=UPI003A8AE150